MPLETYPEECGGVIIGGDEVHRLDNVQNRLHAADPETFPRDAAPSLPWDVPDGDGAWQWKFDPLHRTTPPQPFYLEQFREFLRRVACPSLVIQGAESEHRARGWLPRAKLVILPDAGHMVLRYSLLNGAFLRPFGSVFAVVFP